MLVCSLSLISSARQRCTGNCAASTPACSRSAGEADVEETKNGYDLSPVGFFVLNM